MTADEFSESVVKKRGNILILDRLQDPGNIGTMIRTAEAAGYAGIIAIKGTVDVTSPKVIRSAAGSALRMPIIYLDEAKDAAQLCEKVGKRLIGTSVKNAKPFYDIDMKCDIALVIGNEGNGMSEEFENLAYENVMIPMDGNIESLNAAVAAGIIMYESVKERLNEEG